MAKSSRARWWGGFTLVELIFVMALLAVMLAFAAPALSRSLRDRHLKQEATRFIALTEYARDEAVSLGVPMTVWIDARAGRFGVEAKSSYGVDVVREREFQVSPDVKMEVPNTALGSGTVTTAMEFAPDGTAETASAESVRLTDRFNEVVTIARTTDGWGYEILKEAR
jgi:type II secretion system protein H